MEQRRPAQDGLRRSVLHHRYGMLPDVPIVVRVVLVKAEHGASSGIGTANTSEKPRKTAAAPFPQSIFVSSDWTRSAAISLSRSLFLWDGRGRGVFDLHSVYRSKAQSPKHPQAILPEPPVRISHTADQPFLNVCPGLRKNQ